MSKNTFCCSEAQITIEDMEQLVHYQRVATIKDLVEGFQDQEKNIIAFLTMPFQDEDVSFLSSGLLQKITFFMPVSSDTQLLERLKLRLDSRYVWYLNSINM